MNLKRGDVVIGSGGNFAGKPRPMLVVQASRYVDQTEGLTICLITTTPSDAPLFRIAVEPDNKNGLLDPSFVEADKVSTVKITSVRKRVGELTAVQIEAVDAALKRWLDL